jgi:hypothetical protein
MYTEKPKENIIQAYGSMLLVMAFAVLAGVAQAALLKTYTLSLILNASMGWFLGLLAVHQLRNLKSFANMFKNYDFLANTFPNSYPKIHVALELLLSFLFITGSAPLFTNIFTAGFLYIGSLGVLQAFLAKNDLSCGCLGATGEGKFAKLMDLILTPINKSKEFIEKFTGKFNAKIPLGPLTLFENAIMVLMGSYNAAQLLGFGLNSSLGLALLLGGSMYPIVKLLPKDLIKKTDEKNTDTTIQETCCCSGKSGEKKDFFLSSTNEVKTEEVKEEVKTEESTGTHHKSIYPAIT